ncbi:LOB domain-containing protein 29-like [Durio zibethinus]|uniref:LOB domain-containing protein 29-like n=1 Tax=Durio zibethinus TaxID=66656 RepID=A0A6P6AHZ7_DURZI|nr:LOB domain-containing protein 29-like [Durio zibethinus]
MTGLGSSCGACKFLRRKCTSECVFAPYFCYDEAASHFAAVHKVFGASNVSKLLLQLPIVYRSDAAVTISYEALARIRDPIYGCVAHIFALQQQVANLQEEIKILINQMTNHAVEFPGCLNPHAATYSDGKIQFDSLHETISTLYYQDEQATLHNHPGFITGNQILNGELCQSIPPSYKWEEDLNFLCDFYQNIPEMYFQGVESGILIDYPCMGNSTVITNWEGSIWE